MILKDMYRFAESKGITVDCFKSNVCRSISLLFDDNCYVAVNPCLLCNSAEELVILGHEIGHCETGSFYNEYSGLDIRSKHERRAEIWEIKHLVPKEALVALYKEGIADNSEIAEYFNVTEEFICKAIKYYTENVYK